MAFFERITEKYLNSMTDYELKEAVSVMAKRANTRLRNLERANLTNASNAYRQVEAFAYENGKSEFMDTTKNGLIKFKTKTNNRSRNQLKEEVYQLDKFLNQSKTSTVSGTRERYREAYDTFKEKYNVDISYDDFGYFWSMENTQRLLSMFGSSLEVNTLENALAKGYTLEEINKVFGDIAGEAERSNGSPREPSTMEILERLEDNRNLDFEFIL